MRSLKCFVRENQRRVPAQQYLNRSILLENKLVDRFPGRHAGSRQERTETFLLVSGALQLRRSVATRLLRDDVA